MRHLMQAVAAAICGLTLVSHSFAAADDAVNAARHAFERGEYARATSLLRSGMVQDPNDARLHYWMGRANYELRDFDAATTALENAVEHDRSRSEYHQWLGRAYGQRAKKASWFSALSLAKKVVSQFETAVRVDPKNISARRDLITYYIEAPGIVGGGKDKARRAIEELERLDEAQGHLARAELWLKEKKPDEARQEYAKALALAPSIPDAYLEAADFYRKHDAAAMERAVEAAARIAPKDPRLLYYRGVARVTSGDRLSEARKFLETYLKTAPPRSDLPSHESAREYLERIRELQAKAEVAG